MADWENPIPDAALEAIAGGVTAVKKCTCPAKKRSCPIHGGAAGNNAPASMNGTGPGNGHDNPMANVGSMSNLAGNFGPSAGNFGPSAGH